MQIGDAPWTDAVDPGTWPINLTARRQQHLAAHGAELLMQFILTSAQRQQQSIEVALADAGIAASDVSWWVVPNIGGEMDWDFRRRMGLGETRTTWPWGREVGHLGAGDQAGGLTHLIEAGSLHAGDRVALVGVGLGENYGCAVLEILEEPPWQDNFS
jgi:3-oxoacyl-[acyl-carrier-protein] synthase-3